MKEIPQRVERVKAVWGIRKWKTYLGQFLYYFSVSMLTST